MLLTQRLSDSGTILVHTGNQSIFSTGSDAMEMVFTPGPGVKVLSHSDGVVINEAGSPRTSSAAQVSSPSTGRPLSPELASLTSLAQWLLRRLDEQANVIRRQRETIAQQEAKIQEQAATIQSLRDQLAKDSRNSSKPPSSDGYKKPSVPRTRSLRRSGERETGGQLGHAGRRLEPVEQPHHIEVHPVTPCFCAKPAGFYSIVQREHISNR